MSNIFLKAKKITRSLILCIHYQILKYSHWLKSIDAHLNLINLIAILLIVPWQSALTRNHQLNVDDYRSIRTSLTSLRINNEYTFDACKDLNLRERNSHLAQQRLDILDNERPKLMQNLVSSAMDMKLTFGSYSDSQVRWFILWNDKLIRSENVCKEELKTPDWLKNWEINLITIMRGKL